MVVCMNVQNYIFFEKPNPFFLYAANISCTSCAVKKQETTDARSISSSSHRRSLVDASAETIRRKAV